MFPAASQSSTVLQLAKAAVGSRPVQLCLSRMTCTTSPTAQATQAGVCPMANHGIGDAPTTEDVFAAPRTAGSTCARAKALLTAKPYREVPGPKGLPVLGSLLDYTKFGAYSIEKMHEAIVDRFKTYGPIYKENIAGAEAVHILDPKDVADLFRNEGRNPRRIILEPMAYYRKIRKKNAGLANLQGEQWRKWRSALQHFLLRPESVAHWIPSMEGCANDFIKLMVSRRDGNGEISDCHGQIHKWALESSFAIVFGKRIGCLDAGTDTNPEAARLISSSIGFFRGLCNLTFGFPLYKYGIRTKAWLQFAEAQDIIHNLSVKYVKQCIDGLRSRDVTSAATNPEEAREESSAVIDYLLRKESLEFQDLCTLTTDLMLAAIDTMSNLMAYCLYCLAKNPDAQQRLHDEVQRALPEGTPATAEALQHIPYLKAVVKETTRIFPPVDGTSRISNHDITVRGYRIPANTLVRVHCLTGRMPQYFKEHHKFKPERWIRGHEDYENIDPFLMLPFGKGSRMCLGRRLAEQDIYLLLTRIVQRFTIEWHHEDLDYLFRLSNVPSRPLTLTFRDRA